MTAFYLQTMNVAAGHTLTLDGQGGSDRYAIWTTGSQGSQRNYVINLLDTGSPGDGVAANHARDTLYGAPAPAASRTRPTRSSSCAPPSLSRGTTDGPAYVALLAGRGGAPVSNALSCAAGILTATATRSRATSRAPSSSGSM